MQIHLDGMKTTIALFYPDCQAIARLKIVMFRCVAPVRLTAAYRAVPCRTVPQPESFRKQYREKGQP